MGTILRHFVAVIMLSGTLTSCEHSDPVEVANPWARDTIGGTANAAVFMTIRSTEPDRLLGASTPVAKRTDLMTMVGGSSAMEMVYVRSIDLRPGQPIRLNPAGLHVWLDDLKQPLKAGQSFPLTLRFDKAGDRRIVVSVIAATAAAP